MSAFGRWKCRRHGHVVHPDPGDFVLLCVRCGAEVDLADIWAAVEEMRAATEEPPR